MTTSINKPSNKMKKLVLAAVAALAISGANAQTNWKLDVSHSSINFAVPHMMVSETSGKFDKFDIKASSKAADDFTGATINVDIEAASINTNDSKRDDHLRSADFFDATKFPKITLKTKSFTKVNGKKWALKGDLTMHGITKPVTLDVTYGGTGKDPWGNIHAGFKVNGTINRKDFGLEWNKTLETGGLLVGEEVTITGNIELIKE
jgi:polyisoprenoid-binding protein YceI